MTEEMIEEITKSISKHPGLCYSQKIEDVHIRLVFAPKDLLHDDYCKCME